MRRTIITICFITVMAFFGQKTNAAQDKYFYSDGNIMPGEQWENVYVYNDGTTVNMSGGTVDGIGTFNASRLNIIDGWASTVDALGFSTINVTGGYVYGLHAYDNSTITFLDNAESMRISALDSGRVIMTGGTTTYLGAGYSGTIDLYGGNITESLGASDLATVNIYGHDFIYDASGGSFDGGQIRGFYLNDNPFIIDLYGTQTYEHINFVPEPVSLLLFGLGVLALKRRKYFRTE